MITPIDTFINQHELTTEQIERYFNKLPRYRGKFYVQMRVLVARDLRKKKISLPKIAKILFGTTKRHDTVIHYLTNYNDIAEVNEVKTNYKKWIRESIYPMSTHLSTTLRDPNCLENETSYIRVSGTNYKLEKL